MRGRNRIPFGRNPLAMLLGVIVVVVGVLAAIVLVGLGGVFHLRGIKAKEDVPMMEVISRWLP